MIHQKGTTIPKGRYDSPVKTQPVTVLLRQDLWTDWCDWKERQLNKTCTRITYRINHHSSNGKNAVGQSLIWRKFWFGGSMCEGAQFVRHVHSMCCCGVHVRLAENDHADVRVKVYATGL